MKRTLLIVAATLIGCMQINAQSVTLKGVAHNNRYDDGDQMVSINIGWNSALQKQIFVVDRGIYAMTVEGTTIGTPTKNPTINISDFYEGGTYYEVHDKDTGTRRGYYGGNFTDNEKSAWANNFNLMYGNSGALYANGKIYTVFSRDEQSSEPDDMFIVRQWDAATGKMEKEFPHYGETKILESAGLAFNPIDNRVYGLFYVTSAELPSSITEDPEYFVDDDDRDAGREGMDAGYAIGVLNTETMEVQIITKGLFYYNFVTFAINSRGEAYALTSGAVNAPVDADGKMRDIDNNLTGAQLYQFNLTTGNLIMKETTAKDSETGEEYTTYVPLVPATGYASQYRRQSACFAKSNPNKMYWNGYFNSGKGGSSWGSWTSLPDRDSATGETWRDNGKYDTCLYEVDINTGVTTRLGKIKDRYTFSCMWVDGDDCSDGQDIVNGIETIKANGLQTIANGQFYNLSGQRVAQPTKGIFIQNGRKVVVK